MGVESALDEIQLETVIRMGMKNVPAHLLEPFSYRRHHHAHPTRQRIPCRYTMWSIGSCCAFLLHDVKCSLDTSDDDDGG